MVVALALGAEPPPNPYLVQAKSFYKRVDYESCLKRIEQAVRWTNTPAQLVEIEIYWGLCQFEESPETAKQHFALALQLNPSVQLPEFTSPKVLSAFKEMAALLPRPEAPDAGTAGSGPPVAADVPLAIDLRPPDPAPPAVKEPIAQPVPARTFPRVSIGLGIAAVVAAATAATFGVLAKQNESAVNDVSVDPFTSDAARDANRAQFDAGAANVGWAVAGTCAAAAVIVWLLQPADRPL